MTSYRTENSATGEVVSTFDEIDTAGALDAVERAHSAYAQWRAVKVADRAAVLTRTADLYERRSDELARTIAVEMGKPLKEAKGEVALAARARLSNCGQARNSPKRMFVAADIYDDFVEKFTAEVDSARVGDPTDESTRVGPIVVHGRPGSAGRAGAGRCQQACHRAHRWETARGIRSVLRADRADRPDAADACLG